MSRVEQILESIAMLSVEDLLIVNRTLRELLDEPPAAALVTTSSSPSPVGGASAKGHV